MNLTVAQTFLQHYTTAYAITDLDLCVVELGGMANLICSDDVTCLGHSLMDLVPELTGSEEILDALLAGDLPSFELAWVNREIGKGRTMYLTMAALPNQDSTGRIAGIILLIQDVTEMGLINQQLAQHRNELRLLQDRLAQQNLELAAANAELRRMDEMKSTFVSVAAHELRSPLASIIGYTEMLLDSDFGPLIEKQQNSLEIIQGSGYRLLTITDNLLDVTRIEAGRVELVLQPLDLPDLAEVVAAEHRPQLDARALRLRMRIAAGLPLALCDQTRTVQIIGNLLSNAIKYTNKGGLITISIVPAQEEGFLQISVTDTGVGIAAEDHDKLFNRFFRAKNVSQTDADGAGLGLHITRSLVELHGGRIWFESAVDTGSTFHVTLPTVEGPGSDPDTSATHN